MRSETIGQISAALAAAQAEMPAAPMNSINPFLKNRYADLGSIITTARPVLARYGLSVSQLVGGDDVNGISVTTLLLHSSGEWISTGPVSMSVGDERGKSSAQVAGSIITYLRRYQLSAILGVYADDDTDGNAHGSQAAKPASSTTPPAPQPAAAPVKIDPQTAGTWPADAKMSLETAQGMTDSKGRRYGDMSLQELAGYYTGINKALGKPDLVDDKRAELEQKRDAVSALIQYKRSN